MRRAIISDIHGNLEALEAVLEDIDSQNVDEIFCLGDIVGYGPNPGECVDLVKSNCQITLLGNHDDGALYDPSGFNTGAEKAIFWTRQQLERSGTSSQREARWDFLSMLPRSYKCGPFLFVHGSPRNPLSEYVFPEDIFNHRKMERLFQLTEQYCFQGHTHVPGVFTEGHQFFPPDDIDYEYTLGDGKVMINVGSVGQPRDGDNRACYLILDDGGPVRTDGDPEEPAATLEKQTNETTLGSLVEDDPGATVELVSPELKTSASHESGPVRLFYRRVKYDFESTIEKIEEIDELDAFLGERLRNGR